MAFLDLCANVLAEVWDESASGVPSSVPSEIVASADLVIREGGASYPFALVAQTLGALVDESLDPLALQAKASQLEGSQLRSWDGRSVAHKVVVPWNQNAENPLGDSQEPYLNNPLRIPYLDIEARKAAKNKPAFDALVAVLSYCRENIGSRRDLLHAVLALIRTRFREMSVTFLPPSQVSSARFRSLVESFLAKPSGGLRQQIVCWAILREQLRGDPSVRVETKKVNAADVATESGGDVVVYLEDKVELVLESKDRPIESGDLTVAIKKARSVQASGLLIVSSSPIPAELFALATLQFENGLDIRLMTVSDLLSAFIALARREQRTGVLAGIGHMLNEQAVSHEHKIAWRDILLSV